MHGIFTRSGYAKWKLAKKGNDCKDFYMLRANLTTHGVYDLLYLSSPGPDFTPVVRTLPKVRHAQTALNTALDWCQKCPLYFYER